jgi:hypothetical protein
MAEAPIKLYNGKTRLNPTYAHVRPHFRPRRNPGERDGRASRGSAHLAPENEGKISRRTNRGSDLGATPETATPGEPRFGAPRPRKRKKISRRTNRGFDIILISARPSRPGDGHAGRAAVRRRTPRPRKRKNSKAKQRFSSILLVLLRSLLYDRARLIASSSSCTSDRLFPFLPLLQDTSFVLLLLFFFSFIPSLLYVVIVHT